MLHARSRTITPLPVTANAPTIGGTLSKVYNGTTSASGASLIGGSVRGALSGNSVSLDDSAITLPYDTAQTTATTIIVLLVSEESTQPEVFPSSGGDLVVNDEQRLSLHVVDGGVRLPDDMLVVNE